ncbi:hypothetical protein L596_014784 [Steinernema carpocapsae]|uniref:Uncharacterized protein n=1 Tax=Steinernema carpocapsae TaxID=34508 RepID=A0A4U5NDS1_STECR|nr:hypothetical protein L596_014784 [Steinernema carpocapsae]
MKALLVMKIDCQNPDTAAFTSNLIEISEIPPFSPTQFTSFLGGQIVLESSRLPLGRLSSIAIASLDLRSLGRPLRGVTVHFFVFAPAVNQSLAARLPPASSRLSVSFPTLQIPAFQGLLPTSSSSRTWPLIRADRAFWSPERTRFP